MKAYTALNIDSKLAKWWSVQLERRIFLF